MLAIKEPTRKAAAYRTWIQRDEFRHVASGGIWQSPSGRSLHCGTEGTPTTNTTLSEPARKGEAASFTQSLTFPPGLALARLDLLRSRVLSMTRTKTLMRMPALRSPVTIVSAGPAGRSPGDRGNGPRCRHLRHRPSAGWTPAARRRSQTAGRDLPRRCGSPTFRPSEGRGEREFGPAGFPR
jgi:hypothetical protein